MVTFEQYVLSCHLSQSFILFQGNVLRSGGRCYLTDFGISKLPTMCTLATFAQMVHAGWGAPELDEKCRRSMESDIFSFACTIYEVFLSISMIYHYVHLFVHFRSLPESPPMREKVVRKIARNHLSVRRL